MQSIPLHISVVTPVYGCKTCLAELYLRLKQTLEQITTDFEIIMVNDASPDGAWGTIVEITQKDMRVKGINLSRNFGQHYAITAGLEHTKGEWVVVMDCDLQDQPEEIIKLYNKAQEGWDIVFAQRIQRKDNFFKRLSSKIFHKIFKYLSDLKSDETVANFGIYKNNVITSFLKLSETARTFPSILNYVGFSKTGIEVTHASRLNGKTSYTLKKLIQLSLNVIIANSNKPLKISISIGFTISFFSFLLAIYNIIAHLMGFIKVPGYTTTFFSIWFVGGLLMFLIGIVGLYIGKIYEEVKKRPLYIIKEMINI